MKKYWIYFVLISATVLFSSCAENNESKTVNKPTQKNEQTEALNLPAKYTLILREEMRMINSNMQEILPALVTGDGEKADSLALQIHNGFILKKKLSQEELKELKKLLPKEFIEMDKSFHMSSKKLAEEARAGKFISAVSQYNSMIESCVQCHSKYAGSRFPNL